MFLIGVAEVFADTTTRDPAADARLRARTSGIANARLQAGLITMNQLPDRPSEPSCSPPGWPWPFVTQAVAVALGVVLVWRYRSRPKGGVRDAR